MLARGAALLVLMPLSALAEPLSLTAAVAEARAHGFDVRAADAAVLQAKGDLVAAGALPNPAVTVGAGPSLGCYGAGCRAGSPTITAQLTESGLLSQLITGKRGLRQDAARAGVEVAEASRADAVRQLDALVKQQFVAAVVAERAVSFSEQVRDSTAQTAALIRERYRAGAVDEADVSRVDTQRFEAQQALDAATQAAAQQRAALAVLLGRGAGSRDLALDGASWASARPVPALDDVTLDGLIERALANRPDVAAQAAALAQAEATTAALRRQRVPDVSLFASYAQQGLAPDFSSPPNVTVGLSLPLPVAYRLEGELARAEAAEAQARVQLERTRAQVRSDVEAAWAGWQSARAQARRMDEGLLRSAVRARELVTVQYEKGAASLIELLDAQRTWVAINVESLAVTSSYWAAVFRLEAAIGQELSP